jgi:LPXTG-motif cell wall-anchored protein
MERPLGAAAAVLAWVGWLAICPALGFPILGSAAMINRAFFKQIPEAGHQPNFWIGWAILIAGLAGAIGLFFLLVRRRRVRAGIRTGLIYGVLLWLVVGAVVMPVLGIFEAKPPPAPGFQPADPMQATFMMYTLGPPAAVAALIAWLLFGAILGATWGVRDTSDSSPVLRTPR